MARLDTATRTHRPPKRLDSYTRAARMTNVTKGQVLRRGDPGDLGRTPGVLRLAVIDQRRRR